jgi:hypothetical protein
MIATMATPRLTNATGAMNVEIGTEHSIPGVLAWPAHPSGVVLVAAAGHRDVGTPAADALAAGLRRAGLATLVVDLTPGSRGEPIVPSPLPVLVERTTEAAEWLAGHSMLRGLPAGMVGLDETASVALAAAGGLGRVEAVVAWGGMPDQAGDALARVTVPTLMLLRVGDDELLHRQQRALTRLRGVKQIIGITEHTGSDDETLAEAAKWAATWFIRHLVMERTWRRARISSPRKAASVAS